MAVKVNWQSGLLTKRGLRIIAIFEGAKGVLVLLTGFGILLLIHRDVHLAAVKLISHFHLNPLSHYPAIFIDAITKVSDGQLWASAFAAFTYAVIRLTEAVGLWLEQQWAKWFGLLSGGIYIPVEIYEVFHRADWAALVVLFVNITVVLYLLMEVTRRRKNGS